MRDRDLLFLHNTYILLLDELTKHSFHELRRKTAINWILIFNNSNRYSVYKKMLICGISRMMKVRLSINI